MMYSMRLCASCFWNALLPVALLRLWFQTPISRGAMPQEPPARNHAKPAKRERTQAIQVERSLHHAVMFHRHLPVRSNIACPDWHFIVVWQGSMQRIDVTFLKNHEAFPLWAMHTLSSHSVAGASSCVLCWSGTFGGVFASAQEFSSVPYSQLFANMFFSIWVSVNLK